MRVLLVQRTLAPPGGGNAVAAWIAHALAGSAELATITERRWDPAEVDAFYGTALEHRRIAQHVVPLPWSLALRVPWWLDAARSRARLDRLRTSIVLHAARDLAAGFDVCITADNYAAFGARGIQYVHYPAPLYPEPTVLPALVHAYYRACDTLAGFSWSRAAQNLTLANSAWTARGLHDLGLEARVVYPPVFDPGAGGEWSAREDVFLCVGRFHASKRMEDVMRILGRVRARFPHVRLRFVGSSVDAAYTSRVRAEAAELGGWISFHEDVSRSALRDMLGRCRYGIHAMVDEHFGMAPAEMSRAGVIAFCHRSGGLVEVVGGGEDVLWNSEDHAVDVIEAVLAAEPGRQAAIASRLRAHAGRFSEERFCREIVEAVQGMASARNDGSSSNSS